MPQFIPVTRHEHCLRHGATGCHQDIFLLSFRDVSAYTSKTNTFWSGFVVKKNVCRGTRLRSSLDLSCIRNMWCIINRTSTKTKSQDKKKDFQFQNSNN